MIKKINQKWTSLNTSGRGGGLCESEALAVTLIRPWTGGHPTDEQTRSVKRRGGQRHVAPPPWVVFFWGGGARPPFLGF